MGGVVHLGRGRAKPIWAGHPWVLSGAVASVTGDPAPGDTVTVQDDQGRPVGAGFYAPASRIRVRMLTLDAGQAIDAAFLDAKIRRAVGLRSALRLPSEDTDTYRVVHSEGDGLPGVIADRYADHAVVQLSIRGMEDRREEIAASIAEHLGIRAVYLRSVPAFAERESLTGVFGDLMPEPVPDEVEVRESGIIYLVDPARGQKTGHYADHRENRTAFARHVGAFAPGGRVLDAFSGTGGFALSAALAGADEVVAVDTSSEALARLGRNADANDLAGDRIQGQRGDVFKVLRRLESRGERFGAISLDPPRMATRRKDLHGAERGYKELNLRALRLLEPGGILATASCTGILPEDHFLHILRDAAMDAKRGVQVLFRGGQGPDHPWSPTVPESRYLKFLVLRVTAGT